MPAKLALALAHEQAGDLARSAGLYDTASRTDPSYVSGGFGLARVGCPGRPRGAVGALGRVPAASSACRRPPRRRACPRLDDLAPRRATDGRAAREGVDHPDRAAARPRHHAQLAGELFEAGLAALAAGTPTSGRRILGRPLTENALRAGLESAYRDIARTATTPRERNDMVDRANRVRPRTLL